ncbi:MAG: 3-oxoacyl-ACP reductase FabG [Lentisphaeria bacterium]|nr:3-oxoacyl-ACP reductase FabG [Lentisphaeria bacterium]
MELNDKVAIVTGGAKGIGLAIARELGLSGATIHIVNRSADTAETAINELKKDGIEAHSHLLDVSDFQAVQDMVAKVVEISGSVHILVNNAGITRDNLIMRMKEDEWDSVIDINLKGCFNCLKSVSRTMMKNRWGRIINVSSVIGLIGNPGQINYSAAKAGIFGLTKSAAKELSSRNINVNAIAPGYIDTDMTAELTDELKEAISGQIPLGRIGKPDDIAKVVCFLCTGGADYITGQTINIDGGMVM